MPSGNGILANARKHIGEDYDHDLVPKDDPDWKGPWDCAEFASWLVYQEGNLLYGCAAGASEPARAEAHTGFWKRDSAAIGRRISVEDAAATPGAVLLRFPPKGEPMGHVAISDGRGGTVEAMSRKAGVRAGKAAGRHWDTGVLIPGFTYETDPAAAPVPGPAVLYAQGLPNMNPDVVRAIQGGLKRAGFDPGGLTGAFDAATTAAVYGFQKREGIVTDGEVGEETARLLGVPLADLAQSAVGVAVRGIAAGNPLVGIAIAALPAVARMLARDPAGAAASKVSQAVAEVAGTTEPATAQARLAASSALQAQLQIRLAEIGEAQDQARRDAEAAERRDRIEDAAGQRDDALKALTARLDDVQKARDTATALAATGTPMSKGPILVSTIVTVGFFAILLVFIALIIRFQGRDIADSNRDLLQIVNIAIGALTVAFSTVVTFWLGSSEGSRRKDDQVATAQQKQVDQTQQMLAESRSFTESMVDRAASQATPIVVSPAQPPAARLSNFRTCVDLVLEREGGFVDDPRDRGGATKFGITIHTLREFRGEPVTEQDVRALKIEEALEIYRSRYWNLLKCDEMPAGVDLIVFDFGVNAGPTRSTRLLQQIVRAEVDGGVGDQTIGLVRTMPPAEIIEQFSTRKIAFYKELKGWETYGDGWTNRVEIIRKAALGMLAPRPQTA